MRFLMVLSLSLSFLGCGTLKQKDFFFVDLRGNQTIHYKTPTKPGGEFEKVGRIEFLAPFQSPLNKQGALYCVTPSTYQYFRDEASKYECKKVSP